MPTYRIRVTKTHGLEPAEWEATLESRRAVGIYHAMLDTVGERILIWSGWQSTRDDALTACRNIAANNGLVISDSPIEGD